MVYFEYTLYTVDFGDKIYDLESADVHKPEVGKDYEVKKASDKEIVLLIPSGKRIAQVTFRVKAISEKQEGK